MVCSSAVLMHKVKRALPHMQQFVFANDPLFFFIPGDPTTLKRGVGRQLQVLQGYGSVLEYCINLSKCRVVLKGEHKVQACTLVRGVKVCRKVCDLGTWLGQAFEMDQPNDGQGARYIDTLAHKNCSTVHLGVSGVMTCGSGTLSIPSNNP